MLTLTVAQMRNAERLADENGLSYEQMMENAGTAAYQYLNARYELGGKQCVILAGAGNNAGDGFVIGWHMLHAGAHPAVVLCCGLPKTELASRMYDRYSAAGGIVIDAAGEEEAARSALQGAQLILDAVFGTGFHGEVGEPAAQLIHLANQTNATRVALDVPSGMNADTGKAGAVCFHADLTLSFAAYKPAHHNVSSKPVCGAVEVLDIGIPANLVLAAANNAVWIDRRMVEDALPLRRPDSHKGDYGNLLVVAGSEGMGGAAMMATLGAMRMGAGKTSLATSRSVALALAPQLMEAMTLPLEEKEGGIAWPPSERLERALSSASACLVGCGLSVTPDTKQIVDYTAEYTKCNLLLDADALNCLAGRPELLRKTARPAVITPHPGEMGRLCGMSARQVSENAMSVARLFARENRVIVVLKGHRTVVATPEEEVFVNTTGNAGLAKGGSGDVLAGMIAGLLAQGIPPRDAAVCGVWLHGYTADRLAGRISQYSMMARDILSEIPAVLKELGK